MEEPSNAVGRLPLFPGLARGSAEGGRYWCLGFGKKRLDALASCILFLPAVFPSFCLSWYGNVVPPIGIV